MFNVTKLSLFLILSFTLTGCMSFVKSNVSVFHAMPPIKKAVKYSFKPIGKQVSDLEYATYKSAIKKELKKYKYIEVPINQADFLVSFAYGIDNGRDKLVSLPVYGQTGISSSTTYGTLNTYGSYGSYNGTTTYTPSYGVVGSTTVTKTEYSRLLLLDIYDKKKNMKVVYKGKVKSTGSSSELATVIPVMIKSLFKEFPGKSGTVRTETESM